MAEKMTARKELRQPDALQRVGVEAQSWLQARQRAVGIAVIVILLVGLVAAIASYFTQRGEEQAQRELGGALRVLERPVRETPAGAPAATGDDAPFATQQAKDEAVVSALTEFRTTHDGKDAAATAALPLAQAQHRLGRYDEAIALYDEFIKRAPSGSPLTAQALEGKGYALEARGDLEQALAAFDKLASDNKTPFLAGMGTFHRARILEAQGKRDEAAKVLSDLQTQSPESAAARMAKERLSLLAAQGVAIPSPAAAAPSPDAGG